MMLINRPIILKKVKPPLSGADPSFPPAIKLNLIKDISTKKGSSPSLPLKVSTPQEIQKLIPSF